MTPTFALFGGERKWDPQEWTASDDRVRGGKSQSYLSLSEDASTARFHGNLDIKTLGGAGFASQRNTGDDRLWDLSAYDGLEIKVEHTDSKRYTLTVKDEILPKMPDGREQSTISYEYDFETSDKTTQSTSRTIQIPWSALKPTYRGKEKPDAAPLQTSTVRRFNIMMRSFFGTQEGDFSLTVSSITAVKLSEHSDNSAQRPRAGSSTNGSAPTSSDVEKGRCTADLTHNGSGGPTRGWEVFRLTFVILLGVVAVPFAVYRFGPWFGMTA